MEGGQARLRLRVEQKALASRVRTLDVIFGDAAAVDAERYQQAPVDLRLAVTRANIRSLGGDLVVTDDGRAAEVHLVFES